MARIDMSTYLADDTLDLDNIPSKKYPKGKTYKIPSLSGEDGVLLQVINAAPDTTDEPDDDDAGELSEADAEARAKAKADALTRSMDAIEAMAKFCRDADGNVISLERKLFGDALDEMVADGVSNNSLHKIMSAVMIQASMGTEVAQQLIARAVKRAAGEAPARANRATRRAAAKKSASSSPKAGSKSAPASGAKNTPRAQASTRGRNTSTPPKAKAV